jgi:hypothetical protein
MTNTAAPGNMPVDGLVPKYQSWYGELAFETSPGTIGAQEGISVANRIRIVQNRAVTNHDVAIIDGVQYDVVRAYHGVDDENGQPISDLTLERLVQAYDIS